MNRTGLIPAGAFGDVYTIPSCFNQSTVKHVHLNRNQLSGLMAHTALVTLDLSDNHLTGTIPSWIGSLHVLSILPLKFNNFEGEIPIQLCQLKQLSILDLSENNFSGSIPFSFCEIPFETTHEKSSLEIIAMAGMAMVALWSFVDGSKSIGDHYQMDAVNGFGTILAYYMLTRLSFLSFTFTISKLEQPWKKRERQRRTERGGALCSKARQKQTNERKWKEKWD
ncbi:hypothetical protein HYC85_022619 [Camellia sinensis]|uniref:Uncharacterized protein n=1 Tax=Camellia sinensis TaxID=4442 RepID=A0A7J7GCC6_CAMSI|nr:hypothetical protein HYC85_022619 [Camellia sinensis]